MYFYLSLQVKKKLRKLGGRGLHSVRNIANATSIRLENYVNKQLGWLKTAFPASKLLKRISNEAEEAKTLVGGATTAAEFTKKNHQKTLAALKPLHRAVEDAIASQPDANADASRNWLAKEQLSPFLESTYFRVKEDQVHTRAVLVKRYRMPGSVTCRHCGKEPETLDHLLSHCAALSFVDYKIRHDQVARQVRKVILEIFGITWQYEWWTNPLPKTFPLIRDGKEGILLWDPKVQTASRVQHNRTRT